VFGLVSDRMEATEAMRRLGELGIGTRPFFAPMHEQPVLRRRGLFADDRHPVAERLYRHGFYVPSGLGLADAEQDRVADAVWKVLG
jgi:perosamine synthetase